MNKTILILSIAAAFAIGIMVSPSVATAHLDICGQPSVDSSKSVWHGLCDLQTQIDDIQTSSSELAVQQFEETFLFSGFSEHVAVASCPDGSVMYTTSSGVPGYAPEASFFGAWDLIFTFFPTPGDVGFTELGKTFLAAGTLLSGDGRIEITYYCIGPST